MSAFFPRNYNKSQPEYLDNTEEDQDTDFQDIDEDAVEEAHHARNERLTRQLEY